MTRHRVETFGPFTWLPACVVGGVVESLLRWIYSLARMKCIIDICVFENNKPGESRRGDEHWTLGGRASVVAARRTGNVSEKEAMV